MKITNMNPIEGQSSKTQTTPMGKMEAIARGVQARFEESTGYIERVTDETINIARSLGVTNAEIEQWANHRRNTLAHETARIKAIKSLINKAYIIRMIPGAKTIRN